VEAEAASVPAQASAGEEVLALGLLAPGLEEVPEQLRGQPRQPVAGRSVAAADQAGWLAISALSRSITGSEILIAPSASSLTTVRFLPVELVPPMLDTADGDQLVLGSPQW